MNKKGFLFAAFLTLISWILLIIVMIVFFFIFKFSAQEKNLEIADTINLDSYFHQTYILNTPYNGLTMSEYLLNKQMKNDFTGVNEYFDDEFYFYGGKSGYFYSVNICPDKVTISSNDPGKIRRFQDTNLYCHMGYSGRTTNYRRYGSFNDIFLQLPNQYGIKSFVQIGKKVELGRKAIDPIPIEDVTVCTATSATSTSNSIKQLHGAKSAYQRASTDDKKDKESSKVEKLCTKFSDKCPSLKPNCDMAYVKSKDKIYPECICVE